MAVVRWKQQIYKLTAVLWQHVATHRTRCALLRVICCMTIVRRKQQIYKLTALWTDKCIWCPAQCSATMTRTVRRGTDCQRTPKKERKKEKKSAALCALSFIHYCLKRRYNKVWVSTLMAKVTSWWTKTGHQLDQNNSLPVAASVIQSAFWRSNPLFWGSRGMQKA